MQVDWGKYESLKKELAKHPWWRDFYGREVSCPASPNETLEEVKKRAAGLRPTPEKLAWMDLEFIAFPHFGMSTMSGIQQGSGDRDPREFNPARFDARQWVRVMKDAGIRMVVFVAKHHDGFTLWPTKANDYSVRSSPWRGGKGDMVREMAEACREAGLKFGLYLSLWDKHDPRCRHNTAGYSKEAYNKYVLAQLDEVLTGYGELTELWFDGAGTNGHEDWNRINELIHRRQPKSLVSMSGFGIRWCGNESAAGDVTEWNVQPLLPEMLAGQWVPFHYKYCIPKNFTRIGSNLEFLRGKDLFWFPSESNKRLLVQGWHYVDGGEPFSLKSLVATYYLSVGRGGVWIISPAPDKTGLIPDDQAQRLHEFGQWRNRTFGRNLLKDARMAATSTRGNDPNVAVGNVVLGDKTRFWAAAENVVGAEIEAEMPEPRTFDVLAIEEQLTEGQHVARFAFDAWLEGRWRTLAEGTTIGRRRAVPIPEVTASRVRLRILDGRSWPALRLFGVYRAAPTRVPKSFTEAEHRRPAADLSVLAPGLDYQVYESDVNNGFVTYQSLFSEQDRAQLKPVAAGNVAKPDISVARRAEHTAIRFGGYVSILQKGVYTFHAAADDGIRIYLGNDLLVAADNCAATGGESQAGDVALYPGYHPITILYYNGPGMRGLTLWLEGPGVEGQPAEERGPKKYPLLFFRQSAQTVGDHAILPPENVAPGSTFCNPINLDYRFRPDPPSRREAADPVIVLYKGDYYLFASKSGGYWWSPDLLHWNLLPIDDSCRYHGDQRESLDPAPALPVEGYGPAVMILGDTMYYAQQLDSFYRTTNPKSGQWTFVGKQPERAANDCWMFADDDGRVYYYAVGFRPRRGIYVQELDPKDRFKTIRGPLPCMDSGVFAPRGHTFHKVDQAPEGGFPIGGEGAQMSKRNGVYYFQTAHSGTQYPDYRDCVYVSRSPWGPFEHAPYSPVSFRPAGFCAGAGNTGLFADKRGLCWRVVTSRISVKHMFERRLALYTGGFDKDNVMYTDTYLGDLPQYVDGKRNNGLGHNLVGWMLLSYKKKATASSALEKRPAEQACDEEIRTWWSAASGDKGEWLAIDLEKPCRINAIQVNYAEQDTTALGRREKHFHQYLLEVSDNGRDWRSLVDKSGNDRDVPHDYVQLEEPAIARHVRLTNLHVPGGGKFAVRDLRIFGSGLGEAPRPVEDFSVRRESDPCVATIRWPAVPDAEGYVIRWGIALDKLYQSQDVREGESARIAPLTGGVEYLFAVDAFNDSGVTRGPLVRSTRP